MSRNSLASNWRETGAKRCSICKETKSVDQFWPMKRKDVQHLQARRKPCAYAAARAYRKPDHYRRVEWPSKLKGQYGITVDQYYEMLAAQGGGCAICGDKDPHARTYKRERLVAFSVDHCHETGKVRGLLCSPCNRGLGLFRDNDHFLETARDYLVKSGV